MTKRNWTAEETEQLESLLAAGFTQKEIAAKIGRSVSSVHGRLEWLRMTPRQLELARQRRMRNRRAKRKKNSILPNAQVTTADRPTAEVLAERERRLMLPVPTFGDPLPGYSALDRMSAYAVDKLR